MLKISSFGMNTYTETFAPLIYCVIDHTLLQATTEVEHTLLYFINIMNFCLIVYSTDLRPRIDE